MSTISIIIVTWQSEEHIENCLNSILNSEPKSDEMIIVDNASKDSTANIVKTKFSQFKLIVNPVNTGLSKAINQASKIASGKYMLILNPDVILNPYTLKTLHDFMESNDNAGSCGPQFIYPSGKLQPSCREFPTFKNLFSESFGLGKLKPSHSWRMRYFDHKTSQEVEQPMGSCLLVRKEVFDKIGGMNEKYPIFMNDVDLCFKIKKTGYKNYFLPQTSVTHYHGASTKKMGRKMIIEWHRSLYRYLRDHYDNKFLVALYGTFLFTGMAVRILFLPLARIKLRPRG